MGQIKFTVALVMIALFSIAIIGFAIDFANSNDAAVSILDDSDIVSLQENAEGNISGFRSSSRTQYESIINTTISASGTSTSGGQFAVTPTNVLGVVKNVLLVGYTKIFGTGSGFGVFLTTLLAMLVFMMGLYIWKSWAGKSPD